MSYQLGPFASIGLDEPLLGVLLGEQASTRRPGLERLWRYFRNPVERTGTRIRQAQEAGLPPRLLGVRELIADDRAPRPEVVIENDIAWRVQAMVDFMFGKPVKIRSTARDPGVRSLIEQVLDAVWERSGGIALLQDMALLGHVYGSVDLLVRAQGASGGFVGRAESGAGRAADGSTPVGLTTGVPAGGVEGASRAEGPIGTPRPPSPAALQRILARALDAVRIELVDPTRGIPILDPLDYRRVLGYIIHTRRELNAADRGPSIPGGAGFLQALWRGRDWSRRKQSEAVEILAAGFRQVYEDGQLVEEEPLGNWAGPAPIAHVQNMAQPFRYDGLSEVEPLIPLQDELNTRLSDRASRVTLQCFKMYLAKGLDGFEKSPIGPGLVWSTDNMDASIQAFGGDADSPSETAHIQEIREAMDKISGVPPLASGVVRARIGNLTSANALRITMMGILAKTARKRVTYGRGIAEVSAMVLGALDETGILRTAPAERGVRLEWPDPLPVDVREEAASARLKAELGVEPQEILRDMGLARDDAGVM